MARSRRHELAEFLRPLVCRQDVAINVQFSVVVRVDGVRLTLVEQDALHCSPLRRLHDAPPAGTVQALGVIVRCPVQLRGAVLGARDEPDAALRFHTHPLLGYLTAVIVAEYIYAQFGVAVFFRQIAPSG